jgi:formate dehydrogenase maturation protein FdhE
VKSPAAARASRIAPDFERRAARAERLSRETSSSEEPLRFAAGLYRVQGRLAEALEAAHGKEPLTGRLDQDVDRLLEPASSLLRYAAEEGPDALKAQARARQRDLPSTSGARLLVYWGGDASSVEDYLSRAILRPYAELLRIVGVAPGRVHRRGTCPFCGGAPWIAVRRDAAEMQGAQRHLGCALCGAEWLIQRILCPSCFEEDPYKLPSFQSEKFPAARIEACETCHRYVKSIDLSLDARPIPEVDDLVSLSMDLWAVEQGFSRIEPGLAGL